MRLLSISSITNQAQGGGSKKAGLPPSHNVATNIAFNTRGYPRSAAFMSAGGGVSCISRPVGMIVNVGRMKC